MKRQQLLSTHLSFVASQPSNEAYSSTTVQAEQYVQMKKKKK